jgi:hypothetical protein
MAYICFYEYLYSSYDTLNEYQLQFINKIKYIIVHFLYETPTELIDTYYLVNELTSLNPYIEQFNVNQKSTNVQYSYNLNVKYNTNKKNYTNKGTNNKGTNNKGTNNRRTTRKIQKLFIN